MRSLLLSLSLVASAAVCALASELNIDTTLSVECDRKTQKGDFIEVHYKGTLASNGNKFDASYDRGSPFGFQLGGGRVIKGFFETELMGIRGVPKPESIVTKATSSASAAAEEASTKVAEKIAEKFFGLRDPFSMLSLFFAFTVATPSTMRNYRFFLPPLNFITIHYAYFIAVPLVASLVFWGSSDPGHSISYVDSLFLVTSAMTEAGLNTVNLSQMTTWQQVLLWLLIIVGSSIWVSIWTVLVRKHAFERRFEEVVKKERERSLQRNTSRAFLPITHRWRAFSGTRNGTVASANTERVAFADEHRAKAVSSAIGHKHGAVRRQLLSTENAAHAAPIPLDYNGFKVGRNGQFHGLTTEERESLGGTEYRALKLLSVVVPLYSFCWQFFGCVALGAWIANNQPQPALENGISPWWNGIFNGVSAFNNSGMSVLDLNMTPYKSSYFVLIVMGSMILAGNTAYPIFLRLGLWCSLKVLNWVTYPQDLAEWKETLVYILKYPRRVYTNLFPSRQTWWLLFMLFVLNGTDWVAFEVLNLGNSTLEQIPLGSRIIDGLFQALAVLYVIMMYISVYPVVITMRHSNVYEERSLGVYDGDDRSMYGYHLNQPLSGGRTNSKSRSLSRVLRHSFSQWNGVGAAPNRHHIHGGEAEESRISFISHQIRGQLSHDLWWLVLAVLVIVTIETRHFLEDPVTYSVFNVVFEVVSAYGCVGISIGVPTAAYSFSGGWYPGSKLVLCAVMLRGRHRGLPVALDRAVQLPGEDMHRVEEEDHRIRRSMSVRRPSIGDPSFV
ncbi:cation transport protein-domain-containing protein [Biscogniauxia marginata]|nr:cation transport protein-domain-containing protein [Biscogniauxia marginata]